MNKQSEHYGEKSIRKKNIEKRKLATIFFPNQWNFHYFFDLLKNCKSFIIACIAEIDHSWIIKLLITLSNNGRQIFLIIDCQGGKRNDEIFQAVICELLIESAFKIKIVVNSNKDETLPTNFCIIDGEILLSSSANWTKEGFNRSHEWMIIDKVYDNILEMIEEFEQLWNILKFVAFHEEDLVFLCREDSGFQSIFSSNLESHQICKSNGTLDW